MKARINITVATCIEGKGGISTVISTLKETGFFNRTNTRLIASHKKGSFGKFGLAMNFFICLIQISILYIRFNVCIVHIHMASRGSYLRKSFIVRFVKLLGLNVILHLHGAEFKEYYSNESSTNKRNHIRATFNKVDKIIVLSSQWQEWMNTIVNDISKIVVVYNSVPQLQLPSKTTTKDIILFLGRLGKRKGVDDLIRAFSCISQQYPNAELHLGGDGDLDFYKGLIEDNKLSDRVKILGWISGPTKNALLSNAVIYCLPSFNEGFPMGVLEAMSGKVAIVSSKVGGIPDAIVDQKEGILVEAGDGKALATALSALLDNTVLRKQYADNAFDKYINNFSPKIINSQLESIYSDLGYHNEDY